MNCEVLQHIQRYMEPATYAGLPDIALDAIEDEAISPSLAFNTQNLTTAFYQPFVSDWRNFEARDAAGGVWTPERAHKIYKQILAEFEAPHMDEAIKEELKDFVDRRKAEGGAN